MLKKINAIIAGHSKDFFYYLIATLFFGFSLGIFDSTFNNFLNDSFKLTEMQRTFLEIPRELPGFLVIFFSSLLFFLCERRVAALANALIGAGLILIALFSNNFSITILWLFIMSVGQHLYLPLQSSIGMDLARKGNDGKRLGQFSSAQNLMAIVGSFTIFLGFRFLKMDYKTSFIVAAFGFIGAAIFIFLMTPVAKTPAKNRFPLRKEYRLYYWLTVLYGTRKQIFLTFAPWVLVTVFHQKTQVVATLLTIGGVIGIFFKPLVGKAIDKFGEKKIISLEALILIFVCAGYGFSKTLFKDNVALYITFACYIADQLLMTVSIARATYLKKIAVSKEDITPALTMGTSIDHIFSISIAVVSGLVWKAFGYQFVFLIGAIIALINYFSARRIRILEKAD